MVITPKNLIQALGYEFGGIVSFMIGLLLSVAGVACLIYSIWGST